MKTYLITYHAPADLMKRSSDTSPEDAEKSMKEWRLWAEKCGDRLIDFGLPLANGKSLNPNGNTSESKKDVVGYSLIAAESMEEAQGLFKGHPHLSWDSACSIEIHESLPLPLE